MNNIHFQLQKLKKAHSEMVPESTHKMVPKNAPKNDGKKKKFS